MCGIVGYTGKRKAAPVVLEGLKRLEYRGYDSAGIAVVNGGLEVFRAPGEIAVLEGQLGRGLPEVLAHLIEETHTKGTPLVEATAEALREVEGTYGIAVVSSREDFGVGLGA